MRLPSFVAEASLYKTKVGYLGTSGANGLDGFAIRPQAEVCFPCRPSGFQLCCDHSDTGVLTGCVQIPCRPACTPGCTSCVFNASAGGGGSMSCWDAHCRSLDPKPCGFCQFRLGTDACYKDCLSRCVQTDPHCSEHCHCCCENLTAQGRCDCIGGEMNRQGHCMPA